MSSIKYSESELFLIKKKSLISEIAFKKNMLMVLGAFNILFLVNTSESTEMKEFFDPNIIEYIRIALFAFLISSLISYRKMQSVLGNVKEHLKAGDKQLLDIIPKYIDTFYFETILWTSGVATVAVGLMKRASVGASDINTTYIFIGFIVLAVTITNIHLLTTRNQIKKSIKKQHQLFLGSLAK